MTAIIAGLLIAAFALHERSVRKEREAWEQERKSLLDRIQHPEARQVEPGPIVQIEQSHDEAELAQVGLVVPEFVQVGENGAS